jgi:hypothetical protein
MQDSAGVVPKVGFVHGYVHGTGGRFTIAWVDQGNAELAVGIAWCSPKDNFCRAKGRLIAQGRLLVHPVTLPMKDYRSVMKDDRVDRLDVRCIVSAVQKDCTTRERFPGFPARRFVPRWAREALEDGNGLDVKGDRR